MQEDTFLALVDTVLKDVGRQPLDPDGPQRKIIAIQPEDRVLQILAGPGSGKTEMLVWRILYSLFVLGTPAEAILVTTFTKKAATEIEVRLVERCDRLLAAGRAQGIAVADPHVHDLKIGTLHALCDQLLREFDSSYMQAGTRLLDEHETTVRMARVYRYQLGYTGRSGGKTVDRLLDARELVALFRSPWARPTWPSNNMDRVTFIKDLLAQHTETWIPRCAVSGQANGVEFAGHHPGLTNDLKTLHERWVAYLDGESVAALDFTTVQERFWERQETVLGQFSDVFVDEFQDTNPIQFAIHTRWLESPTTRLTVVGDDDQSIYRFRGSDIGCFQGLQKTCTRQGVAFRLEKLEENWRSTAHIVAMTEAFRRASVLGTVSMPKEIRPALTALPGDGVRLLIGEWSTLCDLVAAELAAADTSEDDEARALDAAILMFSTSEKSSRTSLGPALVMKNALETRNLRVSNPRNKTAGAVGSPVHDLLALISYLIDPVSKAPAGAKGNSVEVHATCREDSRWGFAKSVPPSYRIADDHATFQKQFRKSEGGTIDRPAAAHADLLTYVDQVRERLVRDPDANRLTLAGFVARLLTFPRFRHCGYTVSLFRQALFTNLLEANVAPTRRTQTSLDEPMRPRLTPAGKVEWPKQFWDLLNYFGGLLNSTPLDDEEVDAFSDGAISLLTFHQAKGLEFDHVYVASTGREINPSNPLRTELFSGQPKSFKVNADGHAETSDLGMMQMAEADREREVYVALTRAKKHLTILHDPNHPRLSALNPGLEALFDLLPARPHPQSPSVFVKTFQAV